MIRWLSPLMLALSFVAAASEPCRSIDGIEPLLKAGNVLLLGEIHGTVESPAFALDVACLAAHAGLPVIVGLELLPVEQARVDAYLESQGTDSDRTALLAGPLWQADYQDGRNSRAMVELIDGLRRLRGAGHEVRIALFDASNANGSQKRDRDMGRNLAAVVAGAPRSMVVALAGNWHTRITKGRPRDSEYEPAGYVLRRERPAANVISLNAAHGGGSAWICAPKCGVVELGGRHGDSTWTVEIDEATRSAGHTGWYHVGTISASPPARMPGSEVPASSPTSKTASAKSDRLQPEAAGEPLSETETKLQGAWQAYDFASRSKSFAFRFDGRSFRADGGSDDWYVGHIEVDDDKRPAQIDFAIDDCRCSYKGMASTAIFRWDGESFVVAAPSPGSRRPQRFVESSGQMMLLEPVEP